MMQSKKTMPHQKKSSLAHVSLFLITLITLTNAMPAHANSTHEKSTPKKAAHVIDTQLHHTDTSHTGESQTHTGAPKTTSNIGKHLYNLGKCGLIAVWGEFIQEILSEIINKKITPKSSPTLYYYSVSVASAIIALGKSIHDDYKNIPTSHRVATPLRTIGTIHCISFMSIMIKKMFCCKVKKCHTPHAKMITMAAASIGVLGESLYRDYKAYKQNKAIKTKTDAKAITTAPITTQVPARI